MDNTMFYSKLMYCIYDMNLGREMVTTCTSHTSEWMLWPVQNATSMIFSI